jgi:hypothetical protein
MKFPILATAAFLGAFSANAEHATQRGCPPAALVYAQPVIYQAPVVYTAPVMYNAPVYYHGANDSYNQVVYAPSCATPNVIISGRGAYCTSWDTSPTVIHIGKGHASHGLLPRRRIR